MPPQPLLAHTSGKPSLQAQTAASLVSGSSSQPLPSGKSTPARPPCAPPPLPPAPPPPPALPPPSSTCAPPRPARLTPPAPADCAGAFESVQPTSSGTLSVIATKLCLDMALAHFQPAT